jgi:hypothetical protein
VINHVMQAAYAFPGRGLWLEALIDNDDRERRHMMADSPERSTNGR